MASIDLYRKLMLETDERESETKKWDVLAESSKTLASAFAYKLTQGTQSQDAKAEVMANGLKMLQTSLTPDRSRRWAGS